MTLCPILEAAGAYDEFHLPGWPSANTSITFKVPMVTESG